ncbi:hypothetical protein R6Q57_022826 [Mikania cordata]
MRVLETLDSIFDTLCKKEREELAESSVGASKEEDPENIILGNISIDPYIDYLYGHKYVNALGQEVTLLGNVIDSWFDKQGDWTHAPLEVQKSCLGEGPIEEDTEVTYTSNSRDIFAVPNERSINKEVFYNSSKDSQAELFAKFLKDECDTDFPTMKTTKGKRYVSSCIIDPVKKKPWIYYRYPPPATVKAVPVSSRVPDNTLKNIDFWYFDEKTDAVVIMNTKGDLNDLDIIMDLMDLLKFGKDDMQVLHDNPIRIYGGWDEEAKPFTRVTSLAMEMKLYAGCRSSLCHACY